MKSATSIISSFCLLSWGIYKHIKCFYPFHFLFKLKAVNKKEYFISSFYFGCVGSSFLCEGFLQVRQAGATLHRGARASHYRGLSCCGAQAPDAQAR